MAMTTITIEMDETLKVQAEKLLATRGLNMASAFQLFVKQVVGQQKPSGDAVIEINRSGTRLQVAEKVETVTQETAKTENVNPKSHVSEGLDAGVEEMIDLGGSRRYSTGLYRV